MIEEYKPIQDFETYEISNLGNVRNKLTNRILKPNNDGNGYRKVSLYEDKKKYCKKIHKLVAQAFIPNPDNKLCIDHTDNNRLNNNVTNLRWATHQENNRNRQLSTKNTSGIKGVSFNKNKNKWEAYINIHEIKIHLGYFDNIEDAKQSRVTKAQQAFGVYVNSCEN